MKLIIAIVNKEDSHAVQTALTREGFSVTRLATTGGFLMAGNITFLIGTEEEKVDKAIETLGKYSKQRTEIVPTSTTYGVGITTAYPLEVTVGGATVFVVDVEKFVKL